MALYGTTLGALRTSAPTGGAKVGVRIT